MKKALALVLAALVVAACFAPALYAGETKNIIVMISDGWGYNQIEATNYWNGTDAQSYEEFPVRLGMSTYSWNTLQGDPAGYDVTQAWASFSYMMQRATDSASAATAMSTGVKNRDGEVNVDPITRAPLFTVTARAEQLGKSTGVITSVPWTHATPAGFAAHNVSRNNYSAMAIEMLDSLDLEVIMGAGHPNYNDNGTVRSTPSYSYVGGQAKWNQLVSGTHPLGWAHIEAKEDFEALQTGATPERVCGTARVASTLQQGRTTVAGENSNGITPPYTVPMNANVPALDVMTRGALNVLDNNPQGFLLMIEGGAVDWANHANQCGRLIEEQDDFNAAVNAVIEWVEINSNWDETLLIVTGDHECGYLWGPNSGLPATWNPIVDNGANVLPGMRFYSGGHTNSLIPFYAKGFCSDWFTRYATRNDGRRGAYIDNTDIARVIFGGLDQILPVELSSFSATGLTGSIDLAWSTASESNLESFEVVRDSRVVATLNATNSATGQDYNWTDRDVVAGQMYNYSLVAVDMNGAREVLASETAMPQLSSALATEYALEQNFPNPFNPSTFIAYNLPESGNVSLKVFNMLGQEVATLAGGFENAGRHIVSFDGANLPSALYLYRLDVNGHSMQQKMLLVK